MCGVLKKISNPQIMHNLKAAHINLIFTLFLYPEQIFLLYVRVFLNIITLN